MASATASTPDPRPWRRETRERDERAPGRHAAMRDRARTVGDAGSWDSALRRGGRPPRTDTAVAEGLVLGLRSQGARQRLVTVGHDSTALGEVRRRDETASGRPPPSPGRRRHRGERQNPGAPERGPCAGRGERRRRGPRDRGGPRHRRGLVRGGLVGLLRHRRARGRTASAPPTATAPMAAAASGPWPRRATSARSSPAGGTAAPPAAARHGPDPGRVLAGRVRGPQGGPGRRPGRPEGSCA